MFGKRFWKKMIFYLKLIFVCVFRLFWYADIKNDFYKIKNIIWMHFWTKNIFKNNLNHTPKQTLNGED